MGELEAKETFDLSDDTAEKLDRIQGNIEEAQETLKSEKEHMRDLFEVIKDLMGIDAPPSRVQYDPDRNCMVRLGPMNENGEEKQEEKNSEEG